MEVFSLKDIILKLLIHLIESAQNNSISGPDQEGMPCLTDFRKRFVGDALAAAARRGAPLVARSF